MAKAIETGLPKMRIEEAAARTQARIDSGASDHRRHKQIPSWTTKIPSTSSKSTTPRCARTRWHVSKTSRLTATKPQSRRPSKPSPNVSSTKKGNLLDLAVKAAGLRATLGEISDACEEVVGRYKAVIRTISGVYSSETKSDPDFAEGSADCVKNSPSAKVVNPVS